MKSKIVVGVLLISGMVEYVELPFDFYTSDSPKGQDTALPNPDLPHDPPRNQNTEQLNRTISVTSTSAYAGLAPIPVLYEWPRS